LWEGDETDQATANLRVYVSRLRKALGGGDRLVTRAPGYLLRVEPGELDAAQFEARLAKGRAHLRDGAPDLAAAELAEALALWRGPALADVAHLRFAQPEASRLEELRWRAREAQVDADLARGLHAEALPALQALVAEEP